MKFDIAAEIASQSAAYTNPLTVAEKVRRDYAQMPEPNQQPEEYYDELARKRAERIAEQDNFPARPE